MSIPILFEFIFTIIISLYIIEALYSKITFFALIIKGLYKLINHIIKFFFKRYKQSSNCINKNSWRIRKKFIKRNQK